LIGAIIRRELADFNIIANFLFIEFRPRKWQTRQHPVVRTHCPLPPWGGEVKQEGEDTRGVAEGVVVEEIETTTTTTTVASEVEIMGEQSSQDANPALLVMFTIAVVTPTNTSKPPSSSQNM
jgi:hypothetical protein